MVRWSGIADDLAHGRFASANGRVVGRARHELARRRARKGYRLVELSVDEALVGAPALPPGIMIDCGAHVGTVTRHYATRDWEVLAVEPDARNRARLVEAVSDLPRVTVDARAISKESGLEVSFFQSDVSSGISSLSAFHESHTGSDTVVTVTLADLIAEHGLPRVDVLKTDLEGHDLPALQSFPWGEATPPSVVVCEYEDRKTRLLGYTLKDTEGFLRAQGYELVISEWWPIVEYGRQHRWRRLVQTSSDAASDSWGNVVAWQPGFESVLRALEEQARNYPSDLLD